VFRDGPLSVRPPEEIVYGTGRCALGALLVACSDRGIVSIIVRDRAGQLARDLRPRFPKALLVHRQKESRPLVARVAAYIAAPFGRFDLPLDMRGTAFQRRVWQEVQKIPIGETSSYSRIAAAIGAPRAIRAVASSCTRCGFAFAVPCHRVLHKSGAGASRRDREERRRDRWVEYEARLLSAARR